MKGKYLNDNDLCPLPPCNSYSKLTVAELFEKDPKYFLWCFTDSRYNLSEGMRHKLNKYKKTLSTEQKRKIIKGY